MSDAKCPRWLDEIVYWQNRLTGGTGGAAIKIRSGDTLKVARRSHGRRHPQVVAKT